MSNFAIKGQTEEVDFRCEFDLPKFADLRSSQQPADSLVSSSRKFMASAMGSIGSEYTVPSLEDLTLSERKEMRDDKYQWFQEPHDFSTMTRDKWLEIKRQEEKKHSFVPVPVRPKV